MNKLQENIDIKFLEYLIDTQKIAVSTELVSTAVYVKIGYTIAHYLCGRYFDYFGVKPKNSQDILDMCDKLSLKPESLKYLNDMSYEIQEYIDRDKE